jgi:ABC-type multidrug transport system ATPase subunit
MLINDVCIAIKKGECIGVLGGGGSGKSTLIKLLCGEALATTGEVFIGDSSIHHHRVEFLSKIGYCPQNFCLFERFTATQMLELMGRLRGIPKAELNQHVDQWLNIFGLYEAKNDMCKHLTYGMRRSVCAAMCLIGGSEIILMDEPTSGIDPSCRQRFWTIMKLLTTNGRTVVFTSYNTEECSYLSSRMIVMCEGNVQCLGPPRELIQRFSRGFIILIRIRHEILSPMEIISTTMGRVVALKKTMKKKFKHLTLRDEQDNLLLYFLRDLGFKWGELFRRMRQVLDENYEIIEKYYISESTIDEIFILLTNKYREMDAPRKMEPKSAGSITQKQAEKKALKAAKNRVLSDKKA